MEAASSLSSPLGRISISHEAVAHIVGRVAAEAYGVVGMAARNPREKLLTRDRLRQGITIGGSAEEGITIELRVVVEYGLNLAEVAHVPVPGMQHQDAGPRHRTFASRSAARPSPRPSRQPAVRRAAGADRRGRTDD